MENPDYSVVDKAQECSNKGRRIDQAECVVVTIVPIRRDTKDLCVNAVPHPMYLCSSAAVGRGFPPPAKTAFAASETLPSTELRYSAWHADVALKKASSSSLLAPG